MRFTRSPGRTPVRSRATASWSTEAESCAQLTLRRMSSSGAEPSTVVATGPMSTTAGEPSRRRASSSAKNGTNAARPRARCSRWVSTTGSASPKRSSSHVNSGVAMSRASGSRCLAPSKRCTSACGARRMRSSR